MFFRQKKRSLALIQEELFVSIYCKAIYRVKFSIKVIELQVN